jgi:hypothetical protein
VTTKAKQAESVAVESVRFPVVGDELLAVHPGIGRVIPLQLEGNRVDHRFTLEARPAKVIRTHEIPDDEGGVGEVLVDVVVFCDEYTDSASDHGPIVTVRKQAVLDHPPDSVPGWRLFWPPG